MNIYNNRFFNYLYSRETEVSRADFERKGAGISDEGKFSKYCTSNAKATLWTIVIVAVVLLYTFAKFVIGNV